jgi:hypothetical protein
MTKEDFIELYNEYLERQIKNQDIEENLMEDD